MYSLKYRITTRSPVVVSTISGDMNMVATEKYIPGTTVHGLLAKRFIDERSNGRLAHEHDDFYTWFLAGKLKIGNAYILSRDEYGDHPHFPTPLSIEKEKYQPGVYDRLFFDEQEMERTESVRDFCDLRDGSLYFRAVETGINFHHARDRETGISKEGAIFNYESISPNQVFEGTIRGQKDDLQNLLELCDRQWPAFVGRSKNAQYGAVEFEFIDKHSKPDKASIDWIDKDSETGEYLESEGGKGDIERDWRIVLKSEHKNVQKPIPISLTLLSDLILYNENGFPTIDVKELEGTLRQHLGEVEIEKAFVKKREVENFVSIWRLKKPSETCFAAGSAFLLKVISAGSIEKLTEIEQSGLGERTQEGFGRCVFGWQTQDKLLLVDEAEEEAGREALRPEGSPPACVKEIISRIVKKSIHESIALAAIHKQADFDRLPSNALIAKLHDLARGADNRRDFVAEIIDLREIAAKQLRLCVSKECNLLEFLAEFWLEEEAVIQLEQNGFAPQKLESIRERALYKNFTLIEDLRKYLKLSQEENFTQVEKESIVEYASLRQGPVDWKHIFRQRKEVQIKSLCDEIGFEPENDDQLERDLTMRFYTTFFAEMRKRKIAAEEGRDVE